MKRIWEREMWIVLGFLAGCFALGMAGGILFANLAYPCRNGQNQILELYALTQIKNKEGKSTDTLIDSLYDINPEIIIICDEVGSGIVPLEKEDRIYREAVGRVLCSAVKKAVHVERVTCGIGQCLKGGQ